MTVIRQEDFVASVAAALQFISYYHPVDYITSLAKAYEREQSPAAKDAIAQILINSRMCAEGHRPSARTRASSTPSSRLASTCASKARGRQPFGRSPRDGGRGRAPRLSRSRQ